MWAILAIVLTSLPGVYCYDYSIGGLVAAASVGFLLLVPIVAMVMVMLLWRDWYMKRQAKKGRFRVPRKEWSIFKRKTKTQNTYVSTPRSERKQELIRMYDIQGQPESRASTIPRTGMGNGVMQYSGGQMQTRYEDKVKTIDFEPEEETVIVADVLPDENYHRQDTVTHLTLGQSMAQTRQQEPYYTQPVPDPVDMRTTYVKLTTGEPEQTRRTSHEPEVYHVRSKFIDASRKQEDIFISPMVPASNESETKDDVQLLRKSTIHTTDGNDAAVIVFPDSDEEAGNIPNVGTMNDNDVLF